MLDVANAGICVGHFYRKGAYFELETGRRARFKNAGDGSVLKTRAIGPFLDVARYDFLSYNRNAPIL